MSRVLVACEFSGIVRDAFIAAGHDAVSCDLLPSERPGPHIQGDVLGILGDGWDLMIAHPPRTYLAASGARCGDWEANIADARLWVRAAIDCGYAPVAPYLMTEGILHEPEDREAGLLLDEAFVEVCDELWLCGEYTSPGMQREAAKAVNCGLMVRSVRTPRDIR